MEWNDEIIQRLRALWDEGLSTAEIGRRLGVSKNAVVGKAHRMTLPARPSPIRRDGGSVPRRPVARRVTGPTLPPLPAIGVSTPTPPVSVARPVAETAAEPAGASETARPVRVVQSGYASPGLAGNARSVACCWPLGDPGTREFHFCGADAVAGKPYCAQHAQVAYVKVRDRRDEEAA